MAGLNETPDSERLRITVYGRRNAGKSTLVNALTGQNLSIVSEQAGSTTDPVSKAIEINGLGPCVITDTAGYDDSGALGEKRVKRSLATVAETDIAVLIVTDSSADAEMYAALKERGIPVVTVINGKDDGLAAEFECKSGAKTDVIADIAKEGAKGVLDALRSARPKDEERDIVTHLVSPDDVVMLVMPQDIQAPRRRLILPQVMTIRELLDGKCVVVCVTAEGFAKACASLKEPPKLVIVDSQVFPKIYDELPEGAKITSFSVLLARYKGDINSFVEGAKAMDMLPENPRILIAEACSHVPLNEDIGRVKLPRMLRARFPKAAIDNVGGRDFPDDLSDYDLIIHCGACMFNRRYVMSRVSAAKGRNVPITNYGVALAKLGGILDKIVY